MLTGTLACPFLRKKSKALVHVKNFRTCIRTVSSFLHEEIKILEFYFSWTFKISEVYEKNKKNSLQLVIFIYAPSGAKRYLVA